MSMSKHLGHVGNCASIACAIHCIAMPFVISILPALGLTWFAHGWTEVAMILVAVGFSLMSLCWGYKSHGHYRAFGFLMAGAAWLYLSHLDINHRHMLHSMIGGACLVTANLVNRHLCKTCTTCCENHSH